MPISKNDCIDVAKNYGFVVKSDKLYQYYIGYADNKKRTSTELSEKELKEKIKVFELVCE
jgi:hypothetical protein